MSKVRGLFLLSLVSLLSTSLLAWEMDVHYGLTKWLAFQAGFSLADAEVIARGAEAPDEGKLFPAPSAVFKAACLGNRDRDISALVQEYHFPSYGPIPGAPSKRMVVPGAKENAATALVETQIQTSLPTQPRERTLELLGFALHPLEDSWSHQGEPAIPTTCAEDYAFGHPVSRGGWRKHDADLTYLHQVPDTVEMAGRTYEKLVKFLANHPGVRDHAAVPWSGVEVQVRLFAKAATKSEKAAWFKSQKSVPFASYTSYPRFLELIDLPDSSRTTAAVTGRGVAAAKYVPASEDRSVPSDANGFVGQFLTEWIVKRSPERALAFANPDEMVKPFEKEPGSGSSAERAKAMLAMWLVQDHGTVNLLGHGLDSDRKTMSRFESLPKIEVESLRAAITSGGEGPYEMFRLLRRSNGQPQDIEVYGAVFQFRHCPRDAVVLIVARDPKKGWAIERLLWWNL
jgi:hypothetical protein